MRIGIADPNPEQCVPADEMPGFHICRHHGLGQIFQQFQNRLALTQIAERQFADHERMGEHLAPVQQSRQPWVTRTQVVDPNRTVDKDHLGKIKQRRIGGGGARSDQAPCRRGAPTGVRSHVR